MNAATGAGEKRDSLLPGFHFDRTIVQVHTFGRTPAENMGIDEWLARQAMNDTERLFVRLTTWAPGGITIGYHQELHRALQIEKLGETPVVRRITGGRAVYHDPSELTYTFAAGISRDHTPETRLRLRGIFSDILTAFGDRLGIRSQPANQSDSVDQQPLSNVKAPCFATHTRGEFTDERGTKVIGRARRESSGLVFEHGSIKLAGVAPHPALTLASSLTASPAVDPVAFGHMIDHLRRSIDEVLAPHATVSPYNLNGGLSDDGHTYGAELLELIGRIQTAPLSHRPIG